MTFAFADAASATRSLHVLRPEDIATFLSGPGAEWAGWLTATGFEADLGDVRLLPGTDGSVLLSAYVLPDYYDFDIKPSGAITAVHGRGDNELFCQENLSAEGAQQIIQEFARQHGLSQNPQLQQPLQQGAAAV